MQGCKNNEQKRPGMFMLILEKFIFKSKMITSGNKDHYAMGEGRLHQEDKTIENIYVPMYITQICKTLTNLKEKK